MKNRSRDGLAAKGLYKLLVVNLLKIKLVAN